MTVAAGLTAFGGSGEHLALLVLVLQDEDREAERFQGLWRFRS